MGAALVLGGFDIHGPQLFTIFPHGSSDCLPYATMGSGSLAAMSIFESDYKDHMSEDEAKLLVARSIRAGIFNDLGSGSNIDLCVLSRAGTKYFRNFEIPQERAYTRAEGYKFENGTTSLNKRNFQTATSTTAESEKCSLIIFAHGIRKIYRGRVVTCCSLCDFRYRSLLVSL